MKEEGRTGRGEMKEGRAWGEGGSAGGREGMVGEKRKNDEGRAWSEGRRECWREGMRREGGREIRTGQAGGAGRGGRREGREGGRHQCSVPGMVMHRSMPVVVSTHSVLTCWREGLRVVGMARREPEQDGGTSCC